MNRLFWYLLINKLNKVDLRLMCFCVIWREIIDFNGRLPPPPPHFASESVLRYKQPLRRCMRSRILSSANNKYRHVLPFDQ